MQAVAKAKRFLECLECARLDAALQESRPAECGGEGRARGDCAPRTPPRQAASCQKAASQHFSAGQARRREGKPRLGAGRADFRRRRRLGGDLKVIDQAIEERPGDTVGKQTAYEQRHTGTVLLRSDILFLSAARPASGRPASCLFLRGPTPRCTLAVIAPVRVSIFSCPIFRWRYHRP